MNQIPTSNYETNIDLNLIELDIKAWKSSLEDGDVHYVLNNYLTYVEGCLPQLNQFVKVHGSIWRDIMNPNNKKQERFSLIGQLLKLLIETINRTYETIIEQYEIQANRILESDQDRYLLSVQTEDLYAQYIQNNFSEKQAEELINNLHILIEIVYQDLQNLYLYTRELQNIYHHKKDQEDPDIRPWNINSSKIRGENLRDSEIVRINNKDSFNTGK